VFLLLQPLKRLEILARIEAQLKIKKLWTVELEAARSSKLLKKMLPGSMHHPTAPAGPITHRRQAQGRECRVPPGVKTEFLHELQLILSKCTFLTKQWRR
jgi:hypothetical protein